MVIKRLHSKYFLRWQENEQLVLFRVRLLREKKLCAEYNPPVVIANDKICQLYLGEVIK